MLDFAETQTNEAMEAAIGRRFLLLLDSAIVDFAERKNYSKGLSCGDSCISKAKVCEKLLSPEQLTLYKSLLKANKKGEAAAGDAIRKIRDEQQGKKKPKAKKTSGIDAKSFEDTALTQIQKLDKESNLGGLVPIYKLRDALGDAVSKGDFNDWLKKMQEDDAVQLIGGEMPGLTPEIAEKSITTALGSARYYVKALKSPKGKGVDINKEESGIEAIKPIKPLKTQSAFATQAKATIEKLDKESNLGGLVPIHKLRDALGDAVSKGDFNDWLKKMQEDDAVQLIGGEMPGLTPEIAQKSITPALGTPRYYVKLLK
jgi:hypothetical protein